MARFRTKISHVRLGIIIEYHLFGRSKRFPMLTSRETLQLVWVREMSKQMSRQRTSKDSLNQVAVCHHFIKARKARSKCLG